MTKDNIEISIDDIGLTNLSIVIFRDTVSSKTPNSHDSKDITDETNHPKDKPFVLSRKPVSNIKSG